LVQQDLSVSSGLEQRALKLLRQAVEDPTAEFRQGQWEAIEDLLLRRAKLLVVQRTGWGKSMVYFLTTRLMREQAPERSITLLISPLLALMRDQVRAAERLGIRAVTINSSNYKAWLQIRDQIHSGEVDVLLVSPERLANEDFLQGTLLPIGHPGADLTVSSRQRLQRRARHAPQPIHLQPGGLRTRDQLVFRQWRYVAGRNRRDQGQPTRVRVGRRPGRT
jgi:hypothetical protein